MSQFYKVYGKPNCQYCKMAVNLLDAKGIPYSYVDVSLPENASSLEWLKSTGAKSVPQIYKGEDDGVNTESVYIGGFHGLSQELGA